MNNTQVLPPNFPGPNKPTAPLPLHQSVQMTPEYAQTISVPSFTKTKQYWMPNENCTTCYDCGRAFGMLLRKHHCRVCGIIFCSSCSSNTLPGRPFGFTKPVRVCNYCFTRHTKGIPNNSNDPRSRRQPPKPPSPSPKTEEITPNNSQVSKKNKGGLWEEDIHHSQSIEIGYSNFAFQLEQSPQGNSPSLLSKSYGTSTGDLVISPRNKEKNRLGQLKGESPRLIKSNSEGVVKSNSANEEVNNQDLFNLPRSTRRPSMALSFKQIIQNLPKSDNFSGDFNLNRSPEFIETENNELRFNNEKEAGITLQLETQYNEHVLSLVTHLTQKYQLSKKWILTIIQLANQTVLNVKNHQNKLSILDDVKIKTMPTGSIDDCAYISGVIFSKFITHKKMRTTISNPRILLFSCSLAFERVDRFSQFDSLIEQEEKVLKLLVEKIVSLKPDLVMVEKTVSSLVMMYLINENITVITNVNPITLARIARYTGTFILQSTSELTSNIVPSTASNPNIQISMNNHYNMMMHNQNSGIYPNFNLGRAGKFRNEVYKVGDSQKSILFVEGTSKDLGCSILLQGGTKKELYDVKRILLFTIFAKHSHKMEISSLKDQSIQPFCLSTLLLNILHEEKKLNFLEESNLPYLNHANSNNNNNNESNESPSSSFKRKSALPQFFKSLSFGNPSNDHKEEHKDQNEKQKHSKGTSNSQVYLNAISRDLIDQFTKFFAINSINDRSPSSNYARFSRMLSSSPNIYYSDRRKIQEDDLLQEWPILAVPDVLLLPNFYDDRRSTSQMVNPSLLLNNIYPSVFRFNQSPPDATPFNQSNIVYLHSLCCRETGRQCIPFSMHRIHFTNNDDLTFGEFLTRHCFTLDACRVRGCTHSIIEHERTIIHDLGRLNFNVSMTELPEGFVNSQDTLFWATCSQCEDTHTPVIILSEDSLSFSFGMWLSMTFYFHGDTSIAASECNHSVFRDYTRYYMRNNLILGISYEPLKVFKISTPSFRLNYNEADAEKIRQQELNISQETMMKTLSLVQDHVEELTSTSKNSQELRELQELKEKRIEEKEKILKTFEYVKQKSAVDIYEINKFKRLLFKSSAAWNSILQEIISTRNTKPNNLNYSRKSLEKTREETPFANYDPISVMYSRDNLSNEVKVKSRQISSFLSASTNSFPFVANSPPKGEFIRSFSQFSSVNLSSNSNANLSANFSSQNNFPQIHHNYYNNNNNNHNNNNHNNHHHHNSNIHLTSPSIMNLASNSTVNLSTRVTTTSISVQLANNPSIDSAVSPNNYNSYLQSSTGSNSPPESETHYNQYLNKYNDNTPINLSSSELPNVNLNSTSPRSSHNFPPTITSPIPQTNSSSIPPSPHTPNYNNNLNNNNHNSTDISILDSVEFTGPVNFTEYLGVYELDPNLQNDFPRSLPIDIDLPQEQLPVLAKSPGKVRTGRNRLSTVEGLVPILPNLIASTTPASLPLPLLQDASGLFFQDGYDGKCIVVNENEPSSIIAYALSTPEYFENLNNCKKEILKDHYERENQSLVDQSIVIKEDHIPLLSDAKSHIDVFFKSSQHESKIKCTVTVHYSAQFLALRDLCIDENTFIQSISRCKRWQASGGKSGSTWEKSLGSFYFSIYSKYYLFIVLFLLSLSYFIFNFY